jgi:hypothetical protein
MPLPVVNTIKYLVMITANAQQIVAIQVKVANILLLNVMTMMPALLIPVILSLDVKLPKYPVTIIMLVLMIPATVTMVVKMNPLIVMIITSVPMIAVILQLDVPIHLFIVTLDLLV